MKLVEPSFEILTPDDAIGGMLPRIEAAGRTCYKSEEKATDDSCVEFVQKIMKRGHLSVIEHESLSVRFVVDRGVSHELVRHRLCAFSQESTRYCDYGGGVTFVIPPWVAIGPGEYKEVPGDGVDYHWAAAMLYAESVYRSSLAHTWSPQQARSVLPNSLKTEIVCTANLREWRHILTLRTAAAAHPQMREVMVPLLEELKGLVPVIFDDIPRGENSQ